MSTITQRGLNKAGLSRRSLLTATGAAAIGLWGTVVFMAFDIVLLRPFKAYPWTWDAIGTETRYSRAQLFRLRRRGLEEMARPRP